MSHLHRVPPCQETVSVLYQDDALLIIDKPSGLLSVPGRHPDNRDCVISRLQQEFPAARIVHRLDLDTSGLMVIALEADIHRALNALFEQRQVEKSYTAVVAGVVEQDKGSVALPLICDWPNRPRQKVDHEQGKPALTHYRVVERDTTRERSLLEFRPVTGRSHQLRVHAAEMGHPILGCCFYAPESVRDASERLLLHASALSFRHPASGEVLAITSDAPFC